MDCYNLCCVDRFLGEEIILWLSGSLFQFRNSSLKFSILSRSICTIFLQFLDSNLVLGILSITPSILLNNMSQFHVLSLDLSNLLSKFRNLSISGLKLNFFRLNLNILSFKLGEVLPQ